MDGSYTVPFDWALKPAGLAEDARFRLLILTPTTTEATSSAIATYNAVVQTDVAAGHTAIRPYASQFRVLGSTATVHARDNTKTTGMGVPMYWLNGARVAASYGDFYDGSWLSNAARNPTGTSVRGFRVWTGSNSDGTAEADYELGSAGDVRYGNLLGTSNGMTYYRGDPSRKYPLYGMSPVFVVDAEPPPPPPPPPPELTITGGAAVTEGGTASYTIAADTAPAANLTVNLTVADAAASDFVDDDDEGEQTVTIDAGETSATFTVATENDTGAAGDEPSGEVTVTIDAGDGYTVGTPASATVAVADNDVTTVTLEGVAASLPEGSMLDFSVRLSRALVSGEVLPVPVTFAGDASRADFSVTCTDKPTSVACAFPGAGPATITFTGPSARIADLRVTATADGLAEADPESLEIGLGTLNASSGTNLDGGATGVDNLADFNIVEAFTVSLNFQVESSSVVEGDTRPVQGNARFSAYVTGGAVPDGGVVIPFKVNPGTAQANYASSADYGTLPAGISIAAGGFQGTAAVSIVDDNLDELRERLRFVVTELPPGYAFDGGADSAFAEVHILDNDSTPVSLSLKGGGTISEADTTTSASMTIRVQRPLVKDPLNPTGPEMVVVPLNLATTTGAALPGSADPLFTVTASGTGVSISNANTATPTITFTGHATNTVQEATVTFTATANGDADTTPETVTVTVGTLTSTNVDGGVTTTMANSATLTIADVDGAPQLSVALAETDLRRASMSEGDTATLRVRRHGGNRAAALSFSATATDAAGFNGTFSNVTSIPAGQRSVDITYTVAEDTNDVPKGEATYVLNANAVYTVSSTAGSVSLEVVDNDTTLVSLSGFAGNVTEGEQKSLSVAIGRPLVSGEVLAVPLTFSTAMGTATRGTDYTLSGASGTGLSYQNLDSGSASVTFTGPASGASAQIALLSLTAETDDVDEPEGETVDIGLGTLNANSGTGLDGGARGVDHFPVFTIEDPAANTVSLSVSDDGVATEGGSALTITATLDEANASGAAISIPIQVDADNTDAQAGDYAVASSISISANARSGTTSLTVTDDQIAEDDEAVVIELGSALPDDIVAGLDSAIGVVIEDNDTVGLVFSPTSLGVAEGDDESYTVKLATEPTATVTVAISGHSGTDLTLDETSLTFTTTDWNDVQTVTVTAGEDDDTTDDTATLTHEASGGDYGDVEADLEVTVTDNDAPGLVLSPTSLDVDEGDDASYTVKLATAPTGTVTVAITIPAGTDLTLDDASLTFTTSTWDDVQTVTVTAGEDDDAAEDTATLAHAASGGGYGNVEADLAVTVTDDDAPGLVLSPTSLGVAEGDDASYTVKLATEPTGTVTVAITLPAGTDLTLDKTSLTFTTSTWNDVQTVTVTAGEDPDTANDTATLTHTASGGYGNVEEDLAVTVTDDDGAGLVLSPTSLDVDEGDDASYTVKLASEPTGTVTVAITVPAGTDLTLDDASLTFTTTDWNDVQTVTVTAGEDPDTANDTATLTHTASGGGYGNVEADLAVTVTDDDTVGLVLSPTSLGVAEGDDASYTVRLATEPTDTVTVVIAGTASTDLTLDDASLTFTTTDWNDVQTVTVTAGEDDDTTNDTATLTHTASGGGYGNVEADLPVTVTDNDTPGLVLSPTSLGVAEGDDASYTVRLATAPTNTVTVAIAGTASTDLTLDKTSLEFTTSTWNTVQTVTVTAGEDADTANDTATLTHTASGGGYSVAASLAVTVTDNDTLPVVSFASSSSSAGEAAGTRNVTVNLSPAPTAATTTVSYTVGGSATAGSDFSIAGSGTLSVSSGATTASIPVAITDDTAEESNETVLLELTAGSGYTVGSTDTHTLTIVDDDGTLSTPTVSLSASPNPVAEGSAVTVTARLSEALAGSVTIPLVLTAGTAESGDFGALESITVSGGQTTGTGAVSTAQDDDEADETFTVALGTLPSDVTAGSPSSVQVTIRDDDGTTPPPPPPPPPVNRSPSVSAWCDPCEVPRGGEVALTATASDPDGDELTYAWSAPTGAFDGPTDGATARWTAPDEIGPVTIWVDVSDGQGGTASAGVTVEVVNRWPSVSARCDPCEIHRGGEVALTAMASDPDGDELTYAWSAPAGRFSEAADAATTRWTAPDEIDPVTIGVEVSDGHGGMASAEVTVEVANRPPVFESSEYALELRENVDGSRRPVDLGAVTASDPDGDELIYDLASGDGSRFKAGGRDGVVRYAGPGEDFESEPNRYELVLRARDPYGAEAEARVVVTVVNVNEAPEAADDEATTDEDEALTVDVLANDTDPDGDDLRVESVSAPAHGTTGVASDGGVTYTPATNYHGVDRFTYVVSDPDGLTAEAAVEVTVLSVNDPPEAEDDEATTDEDEALTVDVLANDTDPDGDSLRVESVSAPAHGTTGVASDGGVTYTPAANYHGVDRFTYVVSDPDGLTAEAAVEVTVLSVNDPPVTVGVIPDQPLHEGGGSVDLDLTPFFDDIDGDPLTYRAVSSDTDVATTSVAGTLLTLTPVVYGSAMVRVTAEDPDGLTATQTFTVGVDDRLVRAVMSDTLAAMARSHLASARMTLGRRVEAGAGEESRLTVMGRAVPLGGASARRAAEQLVTGWLSSIAWSGASAQGPGMFGPAGMSPGIAAYPAGGLGGPGGGLGGPGGGLGGPAVGGPAALGMPPVSSGGLLYGLGGFGGGSETLLRGTEFELALGGDEDGGARAGRRWSVWGQGDIQTFRGAPTLLGYDARYDGDVRTGYVGVDAQLTRRWLAGVAVSRSGGRGDWEVGAARGRLRTTLTALHPYAQWSNGTTSVWTTAGGGWGDGEAETVREATGRVGASGLGLRLGLVELRRRVGAVGGGAELGLRADAAWAELRTGEGRESVDRLTAAVNQQRVGAEVTRPVRLGALALAPFGEAHLRRDEGGGQNGLGMEVAFGLGLTSGIVRLDVQGRTLAVHSAAGYGERGAGLTLTVGGRQREGLSLSVSPSWGDAASGTGTLWQEEVYRQYLSEEEQDAFALDARGDYGMRLPNGGLLNWFGSYSHSPYGRSFLIGGSIGGLADALLPGR